MKMKSIAHRPFKYAGVLVLPQGEFSVKSALDAKVLTVARRAMEVQEVVAPPAAPAKRNYKRRDMVAEPAAEPRAELVLSDIDVRVRPAGFPPADWDAPRRAARADIELLLGTAPGSDGGDER